jgi:multidrug resistance efflux pump
MATAAPISAERAASLGGPLLAAAAIILLFFGGLGSWAVLAPLARAAVAPAVVAPENYRKTVQHLEGGIVQEIMVRDGSKVEAGDLLLRLDDTQIRAAHAAARSRLAALQAREARLTAEQNGSSDLRFPDELLALAAESPEIARLVGAERAALAARRQALADQVAMLEGRLAQSQANLKAYKAGTASLTTQLRLIDEEIGTVKDLVDRGLDRKPRLLALQRARADLEGELATTAGSIASTQELIGAVSAELASVTSRYTEEVATGLAEARAEATELAARARSARDQLQRTVIHAPVAGFPVVPPEWRRMAGGGSDHAAVSPIQDQARRGDKHLLRTALQHQAVHAGQGPPRVRPGILPDSLLDGDRHQCGRQPLAGHVGNRQQETVLRQLDQVKDVAAHLARGAEQRRHTQSRLPGLGRREEVFLHAARHLHLLPHALFFGLERQRAALGLAPLVFPVPQLLPEAPGRPGNQQQERQLAQRQIQVQQRPPPFRDQQLGRDHQERGPRRHPHAGPPPEHQGRVDQRQVPEPEVRAADPAAEVEHDGAEQQVGGQEDPAHTVR